VIIVSDTSILSGLLLINRIELLGDIYSEVIIPQVVLNELLVLKDFGYEVETIQKATWLKIADPSDKVLVEKLESVLDAGESAAIALSLELKPDFLAIDEKKGRELAESIGIPVIGLIGILVVAKKLKLVERVKPILDELREKAGFRISQKLYALVLGQIGE
jgi:uncharacterized protein